MRNQQEVDLDLDSSFVGEHTISTYGNNHRLQKVIDDCIVYHYKHVIYKERHTVNIMWIREDTLHVYGRDECDNFKILKFENVSTYHQVKSRICSTTILYHFYLFSIPEGHVIFNIKTLKFKLVRYCQLLPTDMEFHYNLYVYREEREHVCDSSEYLWVDNTLYNDNLEICASFNSDYTILDFFRYYVVVSDGFLIRVYLLGSGRDNCFNVKEISYHCRNSSSSQAVYLFFDDESADGVYCYFDVITKRFVVNTKFLDEEFKSRIFPPDNYGLMDALDGDSDAYWNID